MSNNGRMKPLKKVLFLLLFLCIASGGGCGGGGSITPPAGSSIECEYNSGGSTCSVSRASGGGTVIRIENVSDARKSLTINLNDRLFYQSMDDIVEYIEAMELEYDGEPFERKTWRFIYSSRYHERPLTAELWQHIPVLFLNSIGFGYCGDAAAVYAIILKHNGMDVRVWGLSGHVIPEVYSGGKWQMYDPDVHVYFLNRDGEVASYEELSEDAGLMLDPEMTMEYASHDNPYSQVYADRFTTTDDNVNATNFYTATVLDTVPLIFVLPPGAVMEFPGIFEQTLSNMSGGNVAEFSNLKITFPAGYTGTVSHFLVLHAINGDGLVEIDGTSYEIGSSDLHDYINDRDRYISEVSISESRSAIEIIYLINPLTSRLDATNTLTVSGFTEGDLAITVSD